MTRDDAAMRARNSFARLRAELVLIRRMLEEDVRTEHGAAAAVMVSERLDAFSETLDEEDAVHTVAVGVLIGGAHS